MRKSLWAMAVWVGAFGMTSLFAAAATPVASVEQWGIYEVTLQGPAEGNPFVDVQVSAVFDNGFKKIEVPGFYDGDGVYRIRFMPEEQGEWHYLTVSNRWELGKKRGDVMVVAPTANNHGPVRVHNTYHFAYADGKPYWEIGTTIYNWLDTPKEVQEETLKTLAGAPFNKARMLITQQPAPYKLTFQPELWPYQGKPPHDWDLTRFNPAYFQNYEKRVGQLRDMGIEADLILFNPYGKWGFERQDWAGDERYVRYVVARFGAYRNVWWSLANEWDFDRVKTEADFDRLGNLVMQVDPFNHLRSIHNGDQLFDNNKAWVTHSSIQNGLAVESPASAEMYRDTYRKPVVYDEIKYEGDSSYRWADLTGQEMVHRFWCGTVGGTYVGHGDYFNSSKLGEKLSNDTFTSFGGDLKGESAPRLAFLRKILEEAPAEGIDPIDKWNEGNVGGQAGKYYLIYFGHEKPASWTFSLYKNEVAEGMRFSVDVIDTWGMTITPVEGEFVAKKQGNYGFVDAKGRSVTLPGKDGIALRIRAVDKAGAKTEKAGEGE